MSIEDTLTERQKTHGEFPDHAEIAQTLKHTIWGFAAKRNKKLKPDQAEALDMIAHKVARILNGNPDTHDHWHDIAGYATLVANRLK
jgi:Domain of unknown function (DUF6378)